MLKYYEYTSVLYNTLVHLSTVVVQYTAYVLPIYRFALYIVLAGLVLKYGSASYPTLISVYTVYSVVYSICYNTFC